MNEEINSPYVSSESAPLAPGKLADDKLTVGILSHSDLNLQSVFPARRPLLKYPI